MIRDERGQSLVEFALVVPILLILIVGIFDIGRMLYTYSSMHFTAQETVRQGSFNKPNSELVTFARQQFSVGDSSQLTVKICTSNSTGFKNCGNVPKKSGEFLSVELEYPINSLLPFVNNFFQKTFTLRTDSTIRIE